MKRINRIKFGFIILLMLVICTACNGSVTRDIRHDGFSIGGTFVCDPFYPKNKDDTSYDRIRYFIGSHLINQNGEIYELTLSQPFTGGQNCRKAGTNIIVKAIFDNKIIKAADGKYYYLLAQNNVPGYTEIPITDNSYLVYDILLKEEDVVKVVTADSSAGVFYVLKVDGNVYAYRIMAADRQSPPQLVSIQIVYDKMNYGGSIVDFNYSGDSLMTFIRTDEKLFRMRITNSKECNKYADVSCTFEMQEDLMYEKYKNRIIAYNGSNLITDYKQIFNVAS